MPPGVARIVPPVAHAARELRGAKVLQDLSDRLGRPNAVFVSRASTQELTDDALADGFAGVLPGKLPDPRQPIAELAHVDLAFVVGSGNACRVGEKPIGCGGEPRSVVRSKVGRVFHLGNYSDAMLELDSNIGSPAATPAMTMVGLFPCSRR